VKAPDWAAWHSQTILESTPYLDPEQVQEGLRQLAVMLEDAAIAMDRIDSIEEALWLT
jgi:hypothetical protein